MFAWISELPAFALGTLGFGAGAVIWYAVRHGVPWTVTKATNLYKAASTDLGAFESRLKAVEASIREASAAGAAAANPVHTGVVSVASAQVPAAPAASTGQPAATAPKPAA